MERKKGYKTIDEYIAAFPKDIQSILQELRQVIRDAAPEAKETISYQMPTFKLNGNLVSFAAWKDHIGFYPAGPSAIRAFKKELSPFRQSKGTIHFPLDKPIPFELVRKIVKFRVKQDKSRTRK